jgi:hypothetical protein
MTTHGATSARSSSAHRGSETRSFGEHLGLCTGVDDKRITVLLPLFGSKWGVQFGLAAAEAA